MRIVFIRRLCLAAAVFGGVAAVRAESPVEPVRPMSGEEMRQAVGGTQVLGCKKTLGNCGVGNAPQTNCAGPFSGTGGGFYCTGAFVEQSVAPTPESDCSNPTTNGSMCNVQQTICAIYAQYTCDVKSGLLKYYCGKGTFVRNSPSGTKKFAQSQC